MMSRSCIPPIWANPFTRCRQELVLQHWHSTVTNKSLLYGPRGWVSAIQVILTLFMVCLLTIPIVKTLQSVFLRWCWDSPQTRKLLHRQAERSIRDSADDLAGNVRPPPADSSVSEFESAYDPEAQQESPTQLNLGLVERQDSANYQPRPPALTERQDSAQNLQVWISHTLRAAREEVLGSLSEFRCCMIVASRQSKVFSWVVGISTYLCQVALSVRVFFLSVHISCCPYSEESFSICHAYFSHVKSDCRKVEKRPLGVK